MTEILDRLRRLRSARRLGIDPAKYLQSSPSYRGWTVNELPPDCREHYEERAAIFEFDANMTRFDAEWFALIEAVEHLLRQSPDRNGQ